MASGVNYQNVREEGSEVVTASPITEYDNCPPDPCVGATTMILGLSHEKGAITELLLFIISSCGHTVLRTVASCSFNDNFLAETEAVMFIL